jgi:hypothetical protein
VRRGVRTQVRDEFVARGVRGGRGPGTHVAYGCRPLRGPLGGSAAPPSGRACLTGVSTCRPCRSRRPASRRTSAPGGRRPSLRS